MREDAENVHAHLFRPLYSLERVSERREISAAAKRAGETRRLPEQYESWEKMLMWVDDNTRNIVDALTKSILNRFDNVSHKTSGRYYIFYKGKPTTKSVFAAFLLTKKYLKVRIRTDPRTLRDPERVLKERVYRGWFFKTGQEREFKITEKDQMDYAIELIKQSYALAK